MHENNISVTINKENESFYFFLFPGLQFQDQQPPIIISPTLLVWLLHRKSSRLFAMKGSDNTSDEMLMLWHV